MEAVAIAAPTRLTQYSQGSGCGCKIEPELLAQIVSGVARKCRTDDLLVGIEHSDDAAVFRLSDEQALVFTTDFFTPIVDDPYLYGKIAAANALSDIYAMGGEPLLANAIVGFPAGQIEVGVVQQIMRGGTDVCTEAGIPLAGGHTINNPQPIFGLSAVGMIRPDRLKTNATARIGDLLLLTKPLGLGILTTAIKIGNLPAGVYERLINHLSALNKVGAWLGSQSAVHAMTDVTGFGLAGHALEMARGAKLRLVIDTTAVPVLEEAWGLAVEGVVPSGAYRNMHSYGEAISFKDEWDIDRQLVFTDPQTNGGLLIAVAPEQARFICEQLVERGCSEVAIIGEVTAKRRTEAPLVFTHSRAAAIAKTQVVLSAAAD